MRRLEYTKQEVEYLKNKFYFTKEELKVLDMWLEGYSILETSFELNISTATVSRRRDSIIRKITRD